jgi:hypothetical protein
MVAFASKISNLIRGAETSRVNPDVRAAALVGIITLLSTALLVIVCLVGLAPAQ